MAATTWLIGAWLVAVAPVPAYDVPDFDTQVLPILTRAGCNTGACHGAAAGQQGFHLSLWGSDPAADLLAIRHEARGRRVNLARPELSLLWRKATGELDHDGGGPLTADSPAGLLVLDWIGQGAPRGAERRLVTFEVNAGPPLCAVGESRPLAASAHFNDGTMQDVSQTVVWTARDPALLDLTPEGVARPLRPGRHVVLARFLQEVRAIVLVAPHAAQPLDLAAEPRTNLVDDEILDSLAELAVRPAPPAADGAWLRRVTLDLTGRLPEAADLARFEQDHSSTRREQILDRLLAGPEFVDHWTLFWGRLLRLDSRTMTPGGAAAFQARIRAFVASGQGAGAWIRELLTAHGDYREHAEVNFLRGSGNARELAEQVGRTFLGARLECANCHNHPLDRWTQDDYHGLAAIFATLERGETVRYSGRGEVTHPRTRQAALPRLPGVSTLAAGHDARPELAAWLTEGEEPPAARALVNRLWREVFGQGLVEPVDDLRATNPPTHPELLTELAAKLVAEDWDWRLTLRRLVLSQAYGRAAAPERALAEATHYAAAAWRPLSPESYLDAVTQVTGLPQNLLQPTPEVPNLPEASQAANLVDPALPSAALDALGRCALPKCTSQSGGGRTRWLHLMNAQLLNARLDAPGSRLERALAAGASDAEIITEFYVAALSRSPTPAELAGWQAHVTAAFAKVAQGERQTANQRRECLADFVWSLLVSREFSTNH